MAKAGMVSGPEDRLDRRKCVFSCGGDMILVLRIPGGMSWSCQKCNEHTLKVPGDYTIADRNREYPRGEE